MDIFTRYIFWKCSINKLSTELTIKFTTSIGVNTIPKRSVCDLNDVLKTYHTM